MKTAEDIRKDIVEAFFNNPILGEHYVDWHTEDGECGLTLMFKNANEEFDIIIKKRIDNEYEEDYDHWDDYDWCYECTGYGDDYSYDDDGELVSNCDNCPNNPNRRDPWDD